MADTFEGPEIPYANSGTIAIRNLSDPTREANIMYADWCGPSPDRLSDRNGVDPYLDAGISNKLGYLLTDGTSGETNNAFNGCTFSGLGIPTTAQLFYECLVLLPNSPDFSDLGCVMQLAAINNGLTESQREIVEKACWAVEVYVVDSRFCVRNSSGVRVAWFDDLGNLFLKGSLTKLQRQSGARPSANNEDDEFIVQDSTGNLAVINGSTGDMEIWGYLKLASESQWQDPDGEEDEFIIYDNGNPGSPVAYIDELGDLYLKGQLYAQEN